MKTNDNCCSKTSFKRGKYLSKCIKNIRWMCFCIKIVDFIIFKLLLPDKNLESSCHCAVHCRVPCAELRERAAIKKMSEWRQYGAKIQIGDSHNKYCYVFETKIGRPDFKRLGHFEKWLKVLAFFLFKCIFLNLS